MWNMKARIIRKWKAPFRFDMVLIDEKGTKIQPHSQYLKEKNTNSLFLTNQIGNGIWKESKLLIDPKLLFDGPKIGEGAHAKVVEGRYENKTVAIKIVNKGDTTENIAKTEGRFVREVAMLSKVQHKNLVKFIGVCKEPVMVLVAELFTH